MWDLAAAGDRLIVGMVWSVVAYPLDCATAKACLPIWKGRTRSGYHLTNGPPATAVTVAGDTVFVNQRGGLFALSAQCGWCRGGSTGGFGLIGSARPAVAGGVVYVGLNYGGIRAFPAHCNWPCLPPAWEGQVGPLAPSFVSVTATQDAVYAGTSGSFTRGLHVFSLADPAVRPKVASFSEGSDDSAIVFYVGLAVAALLLLGRARREKKMGAG